MKEGDWALVVADPIPGKVSLADRVARNVGQVYRRVSYQEVRETLAKAR